jgi:hypothetical protein
MMFLQSQGAMNWAFLTCSQPPFAAVALRGGDDQVGLAAQEGGDLHQVGDGGDRLGLVDLVDVGGDRHVQLGA